ncbi:GntR family transcriptional regulator [Streptomyces sp. DSM 41982]|uniref:GntR family transcriptional regulator n=1 Tax=Streptomyces evansiae TaxID=3075535 RepID=A0ABD5E4K4_9ACTN|nr:MULTISPECIES: GntR family transcriptional regulator [unclassified Streptomyces]MDT0416255.1 GntR family transcriptional regulator [Streptomyces sp. DSM 41982]
MVKPPPPRALADSVYEAVKARIMDHEIAPGARVGIEALARDLTVSPTPVREALARLEADGLVVKRPQAGYRATALLGPQGLRELFEMRELLECRAAALAAVHADENERALVADLAARMGERPASGDRYADYREFAALDQRFHDTLASASRRPLLAEAVARLHTHLHIFRLSGIPGARKPTLAEHDRLVRAILRRDPARAAEAMAAHLTRSLARQLSRRAPSD